MLASETGWRMKPLGEAIGPVGAHRSLFSAWECGAEAVGLLAVHDLMSEAEVSGTVLGHSMSSVVIRCAPGGQRRHHVVFTGVEEVQLHDQHDVANGHFK